MTKKTQIGFLSPQPYMKRAIEKMQEHLIVHELYPKTWSDADIAEIVAECQEKNMTAVAGFAQKDALHHILINEQLGNTVPSRLSFLYCMNKYLMRTLESNAFWFDFVDPLNESDEEIIAKIAEWPFMLKNTSLSLGRGIFKIKNEDDLRSVLKNYREDKALQENIAYQNAEYMKGIPESELPPVIPPFIAEHMVDMNQAIEYCYEGYITADGEIVHYALTEEIYFSNHQALGYITPPISIDKAMASKIEYWVNDYMGRFAELGYRGQFFNLEFWIMPDGTIALTEINPRAAHSYHYNYLYSFGNSLYEDNLKLAASGKHLTEKSPWEKWRDDDAFIYTLIILITSNETGKVSDILNYDYIRQLENEGILIRSTRDAEDILTDSDMTAAGVMLQQIWITGNSKEEVIAREHEIRAKIFQNANSKVCDYPLYWRLPD